jgi:hypothetical protein
LVACCLLDLIAALHKEETTYAQGTQHVKVVANDVQSLLQLIGKIVAIVLGGLKFTVEIVGTTLLTELTYMM